MNGLGIGMVWAAVQVTLVSIVAATSYRFAARRGPDAAAQVARMSLLLIVILTPLALCPLPRWWAWGPAIARPRGPDVGPSAPAPRATGSSVGRSLPRPGPDSSPPMGGRAFRGSAWSLGAIWDGLARGEVGPEDRSWRWPATVAAVASAGIGIGLLRLLIGLWAIRDCRRRSRPVDDPALLGLVDAIRIAMEGPRRVEVREVSDLTTAATVGWRRPLLLLPGDWPTWSEPERRAVLAHELAHINGSDYAAGLWARVGAAFHFYHPLVHWLVGRLRLQQELAADAAAARFAGGRGPYRLALAQLAIRQEGRPPGWPARTFLAERRTLIRRIEMLRTEEGVRDGSRSGRARTLALAPLLVAALGVSALRGPAPSVAEEGPTPVGQVEARPAAEADAFDLAYIPSDATGCIVIRPAALFRRTEAKPGADVLNKWLDQLSPGGNLNEWLATMIPGGKLRIEAIDQMATAIYLQTEGLPEDMSGKLLLSGLMIRSVDEMDWRAVTSLVLKAIGGVEPDMVEVRYEGRVYYRVTNIPQLGPSGCFYFPDGRTVVCEGEERLRRLMTRAEGDRPEFAQGDDWKAVERGLMAVAIDNRDNRWGISAEKKPTPEHLALASLFGPTSRFVFGAEVADDLAVQVLATCVSEQAGETVARAAGVLMAMARDTLTGSDAGQPDVEAAPDEFSGAGTKFFLELHRNARVERTGTVVSLHSKARADFAGLLMLILSGGL